VDEVGQGKIDAAKKRKTEQRQKKLIEMIVSGSYKTQDQIVEAFAIQGLKAELEVSQSTISRDLKILGIEKNSEGAYVIDPKLALRRKKEMLAKFLTTANAISHYPVSFFCVQCDVGYERLVADHIQDAFDTEIVGTATENGMVIVFVDGKEESTVMWLSAEIDSLMKS